MEESLYQSSGSGDDKEEEIARKNDSGVRSD